ncbi:MAG: virulence RhuM family protein [Prevotella sp.]|nr:virulence RhuM family protein [Prevotella sp.]
MTDETVQHKPQGEIILYQPDETVRLEVRLEDETVWLTQAQMAELFQTTRNNITLHIGNIFSEGELEEQAVRKESLLTAADGKKYRTKLYNLDIIISVGYRVKSQRGTKFRQWANKVIKEYMLQGYAIHREISSLSQRLDERIDKQIAYSNEKFDKIQSTLADHQQKIDFFVQTSLPPKVGVFFDGQVFDAYTLLCQLIRSAKLSIVLIDNYIDETVLTLLDKRLAGATATVYTQHISQQLRLDIQRHNQQYPPIAVEQFSRSHDRFLIVDDTVYHLGASLKDMGRKWCAIMQMGISKDIIMKQL